MGRTPRCEKVYKLGRDQLVRERGTSRRGGFEFRRVSFFLGNPVMGMVKEWSFG